MKLTSRCNVYQYQALRFIYNLWRAHYLFLLWQFEEELRGLRERLKTAETRNADLRLQHQSAVKEAKLSRKVIWCILLIVFE